MGAAGCPFTLCSSLSPLSCCQVKSSSVPGLGSGHGEAPGHPARPLGKAPCPGPSKIRRILHQATWKRRKMLLLTNRARLCGACPCPRSSEDARFSLQHRDGHRALPATTAEPGCPEELSPCCRRTRHGIDCRAAPEGPRHPPAPGSRRPPGAPCLPAWRRALRLILINENPINYMLLSTKAQGEAMRIKRQTLG